MIIKIITLTLCLLVYYTIIHIHNLITQMVEKYIRERNYPTLTILLVVLYGVLFGCGYLASKTIVELFLN